MTEGESRRAVIDSVLRAFDALTNEDLPKEHPPEERLNVDIAMTRQQVERLAAQVTMALIEEDRTTQYRRRMFNLGRYGPGTAGYIMFRLEAVDPGSRVFLACKEEQLVEVDYVEPGYSTYVDHDGNKFSTVILRGKGS